MAYLLQSVISSLIDEEKLLGEGRGRSQESGGRRQEQGGSIVGWAVPTALRGSAI
jgi:hypothetical protein